MRALALLALLSAAPWPGRCAARERGPEAAAQLGPYHARLREMMTAASEPLARLERLKAGWADAPELETRTAAREALRRDLQEKVDALAAKREEYRSVAGAVSWIQARGIVSDVRRGDKGGLGGRMAVYAESSLVSGQVDDVLMRARALLEEEQAAFSAARERLAALERARRRAWLLLGACLAAGLVLAFAARSVLRGLRPPRAVPAPALPVQAVVPSGPPGVEILREVGLSVFGRLLAGVETASRRETVLLELGPELRPPARRLGELAARLARLGSVRAPDLAGPASVAAAGAAVFLVYPGPAGAPLAQALAGERRLGLPRIKDLFRRVALALQAAHDQGAVHGALSSRNVLLSPGGTLLILEFGLGEALRASSSAPLWAQPAGDPGSLAPEQESGTAGPSADIFALGALLYELAAGRGPFPGPNFRAQKLERRWAPVSSLRPDLPKGFDQVLAAALNPDPGRRFGSAGAFARAVDEL